MTNRIQLIKEDYDKYECNVELSSRTELDEGIWICKMESYVGGWVRGYTSKGNLTFTVMKKAPKSDENHQASTTVRSTLPPTTSPLEDKEDSPKTANNQSTEATSSSNAKRAEPTKISDSKTAVIFATITLAVFALLFTVCYFSTRRPNGCFGHKAAGVTTNTKVTSSDIPLEATH